jgi:glycosyltransferase involved in cell wall biosynthesis
MIVSIVIPCYNEEENIEAFYNEFIKVFKQTDYKYELVFINDGSKDKTMEKLMDLYKKNPNVKIVDFSRNFGKEIALSAGLDYATGDVAIPLDADLQHPPKVILQMLDKYKDGYDIVNAVRSKSDDETFFKKFTSKLFYKIINKLTYIEIPKDVGDFRLISKDALNAIKELRERKRFMKGIFAWVGFKTASVYYDRAQRYAGKTKWNYLKLINLAIEGITSFSAAPLRLAFFLGFLVSFIAFIYAFCIIFAELFFGSPIKGYASIMTAILFLGGVELIAIGIIGEYIGRIYEEVKQRPLYVVKKFWDNAE